MQEVLPDAETKGRMLLDNLLNKCLRVELTDGRVVQGRLICT